MAFFATLALTASCSVQAQQCASPPSPLSSRAGAWNGWGFDNGESRYQTSPGIAASDIPKLRMRWVFGFPNASSMSSQPSVAGGRIFIGSEDGTVYALDAASGCVRWTYSAGAGVRGAISLGRLPSGQWAAFFGDFHALVHAVNADTGAMLWKTQLDRHPAAQITGSTVFAEGRVYVPVSSSEESLANNSDYACCTFRGSVAALDAATGTKIWQTYTVSEPAKPYTLSRKSVELSGPAGAAIWSAPALDLKRHLLYVATGNSYTAVDVPASDAIVAIALDTGAIQWIRQTLPSDDFIVGCPLHPNCPKNPGGDLDYGASPILVTLANGGDVLLAGQKSGVVYALDPDDRGRVVWQTRVGSGGPLGGIQWGMASDGTNVYAAVADRLLGSQGSPGLYALDVQTGTKRWSAPTPSVRGVAAQAAAVTAMPGAVFSGAVDGRLRAYASETGKILWEFDTNKSFDTVNGVMGLGGSLDGPGPVIAEGMVLVTSGYLRGGGDPGNVLLVFSVDRK